jgi:hypothetical protein
MQQALFASVLPEILELLGQQSKWAGTYHGDKGKRFESVVLLFVRHVQVNPLILTLPFKVENNKRF